jgi:transglutaminase-like putative cysteine protease
MRSGLIESRPAGEQERSYSYPYTIAQPQLRPTHMQPAAARVTPRSAPGPSRSRSISPVEGWSAFVLLAVAVYAVVAAIMQADWVNGTSVLLFSTAAGLLTGLGVSKVARFPQAILHLAACLGGYWLSVWLASVVALHVPWQVLLVDLRSIIGGSPLSSPVLGSQMVFLFYLCFLTFFLGYFGAWLVYRARLSWLVAFVYCSIMLVNLQAARSDLSMTLVVLLAALLLLIGRMQLSNQVTRWMQEGLHTDRAWMRNITGRFMRVTTLLTIAVILLSPILPVFAQPPAGVTFWNVLDTAWNRFLLNPSGIINPGSLANQGGAQANFFGDQLTIAGSVNLPTGEVLYYTTTGTGSAQAHYLESVAYDQFDGHTWTSSAVNSNAGQQYGPNSLLPVESQNLVNRVTTTITVVTPPQGSRSYIFAPDQPEMFSVPTILYGRGIITAWTRQSPLIANEHYQVTSLVPAATPQDLAQVPLSSSPISSWAGDAHYQLLKTYYLETPVDLSPQVARTARQWTRGAATVYQAMTMLVAHLSDPAVFKYSITNLPVPPNIDAVSWLLQTKQGFCTYYATAMAMMARLLGVPARVVSGFSQGTYDANRKVWVVNGDEAHSWVQVYFPGLGWINFDPTPGFSSNNAPTSQPTPAQTATPTKPGQTATPTMPKHGTPNQPGAGSGAHPTTSPAITGQEMLFLTFSLAVLVAALLLLAASLFRYREHKRFAASTLIAITYWRLARLAALAGLSPGRSQTPYEYTRLLARHFPQARNTLWHITHLFVRERWGAPQHAPGPGDAQSVEKLWPSLRITMLRSLVTRRKQ